MRELKAEANQFKTRMEKAGFTVKQGRVRVGEYGRRADITVQYYKTRNGRLPTKNQINVKHFITHSNVSP